MKKILIVDDSLFMRNILKDVLLSDKSPDKLQIVEADTGAKALVQFKKEMPDLVFLDIIMPDGEEEGLRVLREMMKKDQKTQVVMITSVGQDAIVEECKKLGARDYIVKPFDDNVIVETVEKYLK